MKNILLCMLAVVLAAFAGVGNAEALTFSEFRTQTDEAFKGTMTPDQLLKLSTPVLAKDVGEDAEFKAYGHAARAHAYWL